MDTCRHQITTKQLSQQTTLCDEITSQHKPTQPKLHKIAALHHPSKITNAQLFLYITKQKFKLENLLDRARFSTHFAYLHEILPYPLLVMCRKREEMSHFGNKPCRKSHFWSRIVKTTVHFTIAIIHY